MSNRRVREAKQQANAKVYQFKDSSNVRGVTAQTVGDELERIHAEQGVLQAQDVVQQSRPDDAPLHPVFEWRDQVAAESYRVWQARNLIKSIEVVVQDDGKTSREPVYVHCPQPQEDGSKSGYQPVEIVVSRPDFYAIAVGECCRKLEEAEAALEKLKAAAGRADSDNSSDRIARIAIAMQAAQALRAAVHALN